MPEKWEQIRPSWKKVSKEPQEDAPYVTLTRSKGSSKRRGYDRISLNKAALKQLNINTSRKCHLLVKAKSRLAGISLLNVDHLTEHPTDTDCFTLSVSKSGASIRRTGLFDLLGIPDSVSALLKKIPYRTELTSKDAFFVFKLPDKELGAFSVENIEIPDDHDPEGEGIPDVEDAKLADILNDM